VSAGQLRHQVDVQDQVTTQDANGQPSTAWTTTKTVWADIRYQSGIETIKMGVDVSVSRASIRCRYGAFVPGQRVVYGTTIFNVMAVQPTVRKDYVDLVCEVMNVNS
jgi:SPP1 family predicted phage head-tail adaptor